MVVALAGWGLTIHSSRRRFAARLNSGVRPHTNIQGTRGDQLNGFGCVRCWPTSAEDAWIAKSGSTVDRFLIDEPHYIVSIWLCPTCTQRFLSITTETIDWKDGEDPIYRTLIPITKQEAESLKRSGRPTEDMLNAIGRDRRSLKYDYPKDSPPTTYWSTGVRVGMHD